MTKQASYGSLVTTFGRKMGLGPDRLIQSFVWRMPIFIQGTLSHYVARTITDDTDAQVIYDIVHRNPSVEVVHLYALIEEEPSHYSWVQGVMPPQIEEQSQTYDGSYMATSRVGPEGEEVDQEGLARDEYVTSNYSEDERSYCTEDEVNPNVDDDIETDEEDEDEGGRETEESVNIYVPPKHATSVGDDSDDIMTISNTYSMDRRF
ncbi:hypothetical protein LINPERPRIM_LOCUS29786 [Linum perenne]